MENGFLFAARISIKFAHLFRCFYFIVDRFHYRCIYAWWFFFFQLASLKRRKNDKRTHNVYVKPKNIISHGRISQAQHFGLVCNVRRINRRKKRRKTPLFNSNAYCIQLVFVFVFLQRIKLKHDPNLCKMLSIFVLHSSFFSICACLHLFFSPRIYVFFQLLFFRFFLF